MNPQLSSITRSTDYVYIFFDRIVSSLFRDASSISSKAFSNDTYTADPGTGEICVARAERDDFLDFANGITSTNPFKKYYDGNWNESAIGGLSSPIIDPGSSYFYRETPSVSYNHSIDEFVMLVWGQDSTHIHSIKLHIPDPFDTDLTDWEDGLRLDLSIADAGINVESGAQGKYPSLVSRDTFEGAVIGSALDTGEDNYLYFSDFSGDLSASSKKTLYRIKMTIPH